ncbi:exosortase A [Pseudothauera nasutitermitis]|uniref:Exosortase A n=1 Tax=Pseudothauera nasutitermitis TaxID=2565930 RepID=A0A4S4AVQ7_9RHOO|nr:exosortase A [Pseudothauera nasutitermitis]THF63660.1 exosortase A [Pseudothauera nasutitermitis]
MRRDALSAAVPVRAAGGAVAVGVALAVTFAWMVGWYWPTAREIAGIWWRSETFAHGLAVLPLCAWLVWRQRARLAGLRPAPRAWPALAVVAGAGVAWMLGQLAAVAALSHLAFATMLVAVLAGVLGGQAARVLAFPLGFLFFGVPLGEFLMPWLMAHTATFTVGALRLSGVPVFQEGLHFIVPNGRWSVVEACSGIRYLIASLMIGTLYAHLHYRSLRRRLAFVALAAVVPIVANWMRAYLIVLLGYLSDNRVAAGVDHLIYGWVFFGVVILLMFAIGARWREDLQPGPVPTAPRVQAAVPAGRALAAVAVLAAASAFFPLLQAHLDAPQADYRVALAWPAEVPGWVEDPAAESEFRPHYLGARGELRRSWRRGDEVVSVHLAYFADQRPGHELVTWSNRLVAPESNAWLVHAREADTLPVGTDGGTVEVRRATVTRADERLRVAVWEWYWMDGRVVTSEVRAKVLKALDRLTGRADDAAYIALLVPQGDDPEAARRSARAFAEAAGPALLRVLDDAAVQAGAQR